MTLDKALSRKSFRVKTVFFVKTALLRDTLLRQNHSASNQTFKTVLQKDCLLALTQKHLARSLHNHKAALKRFCDSLARSHYRFRLLRGDIQYFLLL